MKVIQQDMLELRSGILFHQVNCQGVMGGGIARAFSLKYPGLEPEYREICRKNGFDGNQLLGKVFLWKADKDLHIANVFGQDEVSRSERMTSYDATVEAFEKIRRSIVHAPSYTFAKFSDRLYFPYKMGCGLGGGNWSIYASIIEAYFPAAIICKHE